jgi:hypothetical protein
VNAWESAPLVEEPPTPTPAWQQAPTVQDVPFAGLEPAHASAFPVGMLEPGTQNPFDYAKYPKVRNPDGSFSNVKTTSFNIDGQEVLLPTMVGGKNLRQIKPDGSVDDSQVIQRYRDTGEHFGTFDSPESANAFADKVERLMQREGAQPPSSPAAQGALNSTAVGRVMRAFGSGLSQPFQGVESYGLSPEARKWFQEEGVFMGGKRKSALPSFITEPIQAFNEGVVSFVANEADFLLKGLYAPFTALAKTVGQVSEETGLATRLGYYEYNENGEQASRVADDVLGAVDSLGIVLGAHIPMAGTGGIRRSRIAASEKLREEQIPSREPPTNRAPPPIEPSPAVPPDVIAVPPGGFHAAPPKPELPPLAGPSVRVGEQVVRFPDEAHAALFEYGEKLAFGEEDAAARAAIAARNAGMDIDAEAKTYYDAVAKKVEGQAGEVDAPRVGEPTPERFTTSPGAIAAEHDQQVTQLETEAMQAAVERRPDYGAANRIVTRADADETRAVLREKAAQANVGLDPDAITAAFKLAVYHIEAGARSFVDFSRAVIADVGEWARPHLQEWYDQAVAAISEFSRSEYGGSLPRSQRVTRPPPEMINPQRAGNINLDRISAGEDVLNVIRETAAQNAGFETARRGRMTFEDIQNLADSAGVNPKQLVKAKVGTAFSAEEAVALRDYLVASAAKVQELSQTVLGGSDEQLLEFERALTRHQAIQEKVAGMTAEAGRALASFNIKAEATEKAKRLAELLEAKGGRATIEEKASAIRKLNDPEAVSRTILNMRKATVLDMILEAWINGLLSGPLTHATNTISNTLTNVTNIGEMALAAGIGTVRESLGVGVGAEKVALGEVQARAFAMLNGSKDYLAAAKEAFADDLASSTSTGKIEVKRPQAIPSFTVNIPGIGPTKIGGATVRIPGRLLSASDAFFQTMARRQEISALAFRKATNEGLAGNRLATRIAELIADPTKEMVEQAQKTGTYLTFTKPLGPTGRYVQGLFNSHPMLKFIVPFTRTPTNILKYAGERSVLSVFSKEVRANLRGENGQIAQDTQLARITLGTAVTLATLQMAMNGDITGGGPRDPNARALLYMTGWQPYSVRVGDTYYSYLRALGPLGVLMGVSADAAEISHDVDSGDASEIGKLVFASATQNLVNQTWLQGPADLLQAVEDPQRYGAPWVRGMTASLVPAGIAQEARASDPYLREARSIIDGVKARIPGLSQTLLPRRDLWGNEIVREGSLGPDILSPVYQMQIKNDLIAREMLRLGVWKAAPPRTIRGVDLTDAQYDDYQKIAGRLARQSLTMVVGGAGWDQLPPATQAEIIDRLFDRSRESARSFMMISHPELLNDIIRSRIEDITGEPKKSGLVPYPAMPVQ